jgi:hypothetical protein
MAIGWRQFDNVNSDFRQAGFGYTLDGGQTWIFPGVVIDSGTFRSDPVLAADAEGRFYYNTLTLDTNFRCNVYRSTGDGTWDNGVYAYGGDKQWMTIDQTNGPGKGNIYADWNKSFTVCDPGFFTRSTDGGDSYEPCSPIVPDDLFWGTMDVGPDGTLYAVGNGHISRSTDAQNSAVTPTWTTTSASGNLFGGQFQGFAQNSPNPVGLLGQAWVATNHAAGPLYGQVYVLGSVHRDNTMDPVDVMFNRSTDGGITWTTPIKINDDADTTNWQWFGTMSVSPNGRIDAVWLDSRDNPGTVLSSLYYSNSIDGGLTWSANLRLSDAFDPHLGWPIQQKMGDYYHMVSDNNGFNLAWAGTFNGEEDVYYGRYNLNPTATRDIAAGMPNQLYQNYPNPFDGQTTIRYSIVETGRVQITVFNQLGASVAVLANELKQAGDYAIQWDGKDGSGHPLPSGVYNCEMTFDGKDPVYLKMIILKATR